MVRVKFLMAKWSSSNSIVGKDSEDVEGTVVCCFENNMTEK